MSHHFSERVRTLVRRELFPHREEMSRALADHVRAQVPAYAEGSVVSADDLEQSLSDNIDFILRTIIGLQGAGLAAARVTGARRARQGWSYADMLAAYRVGMQFVWERILAAADTDERDEVLLAGSQIWAVSDEFATAASQAYQAELIHLSRRIRECRAALVAALLDGDDLDSRGWPCSTILDLPGRAYVAVVGECDTGDEALTDVEHRLNAERVPSAWRLTIDRQEGIVALQRGFDVDQLTETLGRIARGRVGLSRPFDRIESSAVAAREARRAMRCATPGHVEVVSYGTRPIATLLATTAQGVDDMLEILGPLLSRPQEEVADLMATARTWYSCGGSTSEAAEQLYMHRNTIRARMTRLEGLVGLDTTDAAQSAVLFVALEAARIRGIA